MAVSFDMSKMIALRARLPQLLEQREHQVVTKITLDVAARLIEATPVDTGYARGNYVIETPAAPGQAGRVTNNTEYMDELVNGRSDQAAQGWAENAIEAAALLGGRS